MAKIYRVIEIKFNQLVYEKCPYDHWLTNKAYLSAITVTNFIRVLPTRWRQKSTGIDMKQNYVTITLCIDRQNRETNRRRRHRMTRRWKRTGRDGILVGAWRSIAGHLTCGSAVFAGATVVTNTQTDHATPSVATARAYSTVYGAGDETQTVRTVIKAFISSLYL